MGYKKIPTTSTSTTTQNSTSKNTQTNKSNSSSKSWTTSNVSDATKNQLAAAESPYVFSYSEQQKQNINNILNHKPFEYNLNGDGLYQQYAKQYAAMGNMAMQDTMANAATLSGGYANSYAQTAGQQAYNSYMQQLNNVVPELYQQAYNRYAAERENLYNQANMFANLDATERSAYDTDRNYAYAKYADEWNRNAQTHSTSKSTDKSTSKSTDKTTSNTVARDEQFINTGSGSGGGGSSSKSGSGSGSKNSSDTNPTRSWTAAKNYLEANDFDQEDYRDMMTQTEWEQNKTAVAREGDWNYGNITTARQFNTYDEYLAWYINEVENSADV